MADKTPWPADNAVARVVKQVAVWWLGDVPSYDERVDAHLSSETEVAENQKFLILQKLNAELHQQYVLQPGQFAGVGPLAGTWEEVVDYVWSLID